MDKQYNHTLNGGRKEHAFECTNTALIAWSILNDT